MKRRLDKWHDLLSNRHVYVVALGCLCLGVVFLLPLLLSLPYDTRVHTTRLTSEADGSLAYEIETPWPFRINKYHLDRITVALPDGRELVQYPMRLEMIEANDGPGFFVDRPHILLSLPRAMNAGAEIELAISLPVKVSDSFHKLFFLLGGVLLGLVWLGSGLLALFRPDHRRALLVTVASALVSLSGIYLLPRATGMTVWLSLLFLSVGLFAALGLILGAGDREGKSDSRVREPIARVAVLLAAVFGCFALLEGVLSLAPTKPNQAAPVPTTTDEAWFHLPPEIVSKAKARNQSDLFTLPDAWRKRTVEVPGATRAYMWHASMHLHDIHGFRRLNGPFPKKQQGTARVMVVGDSLTYGYGVAEESTFSRLLQSALRKDRPIEVINLGRSGYQSEDTLRILRRFFAQLEPDLVVYAVCLNDFLPSGIGEYSHHAFPLPKAWKTFLQTRTRLARLSTEGYDALLIALGLRADFYDDVLGGGTTYKDRFARDVQAMAAFVEEQGLPKIVGLVFHHRPGGDPRGWDLVEIAEAALKDGSFDLISISPWRERFKDQVFPVSRWEGHPNELAHSLVAEALYNHIRERAYFGSDRQAETR